MGFRVRLDGGFGSWGFIGEGVGGGVEPCYSCISAATLLREAVHMDWKVVALRRFRLRSKHQSSTRVACACHGLPSYVQ